jgi:hypothetical protein
VDERHAYLALCVASSVALLLVLLAPNDPANHSLSDTYKAKDKPHGAAIEHK